MKLTRRTLLVAAAGSLAAPALVRAQGEVPIRIGEINSYTAVPAFTVPYRNGWQMAVDQVNKEGGVLGRKLEVISRDDAGKPQDAIRLAGELLNDQKVDLLAGGFLSNIGLAISDFAKRNKKLYIAGEPLTDALVWSEGNRYCYRLRPSTYMQAAMLVDDAAKLPGNKWVTVAPNYEYGQSAVKWFKLLLAKKRPDVVFLTEQWPALGKIDAGATVAALEAAKPDNIFNVTFGADLTNFVRAGNTRGLFEKRGVVSVLTGEPEYLDPLGDETPEGWIVTGYPVDSVINTSGTHFIAAYKELFKDLPKMGSVVGHALITSIAAGITKTGSVDTEKMADGFGGVAFDTPFGRALWRKQDHQSTLGTYVGKTTVKDGKPKMIDWRYVDGSGALPDDAEVAKLRPAG
jgi:branched-chain amino acid transport system substrate-binding protein